MKKSFLKHDHAILTCMVQARTPERIRALMSASLSEGAEAFGMQFCQLLPEYRTPAVYRDLFSFSSPLPTYVTNYRGHASNEGKSDDTLADELLEIAECGATLVDVMGDLFDPCIGELTDNEEAVKKQKTLIRALHERGAEVLMSSHVMKFTPAEEVLKIALAHKERGADISKIVTGAESVEEEIENLRIIRLLKRELDIPFLFLCGGECHILRRIGGTLGSAMTLCVHEYDDLATPVQPLLRDAYAVGKLMEETK